MWSEKNTAPDIAATSDSAMVKGMTGGSVTSLRYNGILGGNFGLNFHRQLLVVSQI